MAIPKFLTEELAEFAVRTVLTAVMNNAKSIGLKKTACHICVVVPTVDRHLSHYNRISPHTLYERSLNQELWSADNAKIANNEALQLWEDRNDGRTDIMPHLLFPGDTVYYGGVKRRGIVVTCSGVQPPLFNQMIAGMISDTLIALAYNAWRTSVECKMGMDFLE